MKSRINKTKIIVTTLYFLLFPPELSADELTLATVAIQEPIGVSRSLEYVELQLQIKLNEINDEEINISAENHLNGERISCQVIVKKEFGDENAAVIKIIFPISIEANERKVYLLKRVERKNVVKTDLKISGEGLDLNIDNKYYIADLSKSTKYEGKSKNSGQLSELKIKMGFDLLFFRTKNRMHWAPNFQKEGLENYSTIAGWEEPKIFELNHGPYLVSSKRQDFAQDHSEILLTANYSFYADLPYFKFYSSMKIVEDVKLFLLRNDEMTMDSLFTNIAYQNDSGEIIDLSFPERYDELEENPIQNNDPWLCFYNENRGYGFGSIRIKYDNVNHTGLPSPTYLPHTKISDGANGGKYWNRRLIHEKTMLVPKGSSYVEENVYLVFEISEGNKFKEIINWMNVIRNPVEVTLLFEE